MLNVNRIWFNYSDMELDKREFECGEICSCCGSFYEERRITYDSYSGRGIDIEITDCVPKDLEYETDLYWIEEIHLDSTYTMLVKHNADEEF